MTLRIDKEHTSHRLANMADCSIDSTDAEGFLRSVVSNLAEAVEYADDGFDWGDLTHEVADGCVPIYTQDIWSTFVGCRAWNEDPSELCSQEDTSMEKQAQVALFLIAERLCDALLREAQENEDEEDDDE